MYTYKQDIKEMIPIRVLELFSGYGTTTFALKRLNKPYKLIGYSDIDKYANQIFKQNHCPNDTEDKLQLGDVTKIIPENLPDFDLLTAGFPCQAFSQAGHMQGELDPRGTLFYEIIRIAEVKQPRYMLLENVKGLTSKRFRDTFNKILSELGRIGYKVHWKVLNTADYGIPQNRDRVWFVCFKEQKDYDNFQWPEKEELKIFIKDIIEEEVDEKYYLSEKLQERFKSYIIEKYGSIEFNGLLDPYNKSVNDKVSGAIGTSIGTSTGKTAQIVAMRSYPRTGTKEQDGDRFQNFEPNKKETPNSITSVQKDNLVYDLHRANEIREYKRVSPTLTGTMGTGGNRMPMVKDNLVVDNSAIENVENNYLQGKLRRLTPKECFRLQGFINDEIITNNISDTQLYKLAGNGQSINVVTKILNNML